MPLPSFSLRVLQALAFLSGASYATAQTAPIITRWQTARSYARVFETASDKTSGNAVATWPRSGLTNGGGGQATAVYSDVQRVVYSSNYVYIYSTGLASYNMGNWLTPNGGVYTSWPTNRAAIHRLPLTTSIPTTKQKTNGSGGLLLNGVFVWANGDAQSYTTSTGVVSMQGQGIWNRLAGVAEAFNFDPGLGHQPGNGAYHNHINPIALRYQLGDNVTYNAATKAYAESANITKHSPLLGFANDGLPIYGPYGYSTATDATSGIRRMTTGFQKRNGTNGSINLATTGRTTLPTWAASVQGKTTTLASTEYGPTTTATYQIAPNVTGTYSIGIFAEDYDYMGDLGKTQGVDFDLNRQNVRFCVTPEYPAGTWAYFVAIDASGTTVFPDLINQEYFGSVPNGPSTVTSISETVTEYIRGGQASALSLAAVTDPAGVKLTWPSVEGATYTIASSPDGTTYSNLATVGSAGGRTTSTTTPTVASHYKVTLTAVASYDTNGNGGVSGVGTSATATYTVPAVAPAITTAPVSQSVTAGTSVTFSVVASGTAPLTYQWSKGTSAIAGATASSYNIASPVVGDTGTYNVAVTNSAGTANSSATLNVTAPLTSFQAFVEAKFTAAQQADPAISGMTADPDGDGLSNVLECAFSLDPNVRDASGATSSALSGSHLTITFKRLVNPNGLTYSVESSGDLATWNSGDTYTEQVSATPIAGGTSEQVVVRDRTATTAATRRFLRVRVTAQ
ncbi:MAG TPA: YHYH protein [Chthoniobacterales bacterium]|jgi:hypothetical protein